MSRLRSIKLILCILAAEKNLLFNIDSNQTSDLTIPQNKYESTSLM